MLVFIYFAFLPKKIAFVLLIVFVRLDCVLILHIEQLKET